MNFESQKMSSGPKTILGLKKIVFQKHFCSKKTVRYNCLDYNEACNTKSWPLWQYTQLEVGAGGGQ